MGEFDAKVRKLATTPTSQHKISFSNVICIQADNAAQAGYVLEATAHVAAAVAGDEQEEEAADEEEQEDVLEPSVADSASGHAVGDVVECYWPDDDVWLRALITAAHRDGSLTITWDEDGSQSSVPADYVRVPQDTQISNPLLSVSADECLAIERSCTGDR